jgi:hypothetical protein
MFKNVQKWQVSTRRFQKCSKMFKNVQELQKSARRFPKMEAARRSRALFCSRRLLGVTESPDDLFVVSEFAAGGSLADVLASEADAGLSTLGSTTRTLQVLCIAHDMRAHALVERDDE